AIPESLSGFNLDINLSNFVGASDIYGVEVHLLYDENTYYYDNPNSPIINGNIFKPQNSADHIKEYQGSTGKELVYAVTNFGSTSGNITVTGAQKLVTIPLHGFGEQTITVGKIVIVRKNGSTVQNIEIPLTNIQPVTITTELPELPDVPELPELPGV
ncbi:MAG: hypothetical protein K0Q73_3260, partial [Paenibacillus sp.]|nr:hypothetical protein [Paenibacillus sp.]